MWIKKPKKHEKNFEIIEPLKKKGRLRGYSFRTGTKTVPSPLAQMDEVEQIIKRCKNDDGTTS